MKLEYHSTIKVPEWLWVAYQTEPHGLNEAELQILEQFKKDYGLKFHMDDKGREPYFSWRNDFDKFGDNVYDVDLYEDKEDKK